VRTILGRDGIGRVIALVVGAAVGLRAMQVARNFNAQGSYSTIAAGGTMIGLLVAVVFVAGLAIWRGNRRPDGTGGPRFVALDAGVIVGALVGWVVFGAG
jgi:hypothetical protein